MYIFMENLRKLSQNYHQIFLQSSAHLGINLTKLPLLLGKAWVNSAETYHMQQTLASEHGLHCLPLMQQFLDTSTGSKINFFKFKGKYGKK